MFRRHLTDLGWLGWLSSSERRLLDDRARRVGSGNMDIDMNVNLNMDGNMGAYNTNTADTDTDTDTGTSSLFSEEGLRLIERAVRNGDEAVFKQSSVNKKNINEGGNDNNFRYYLDTAATVINVEKYEKYENEDLEVSAYIGRSTRVEVDVLGLGRSIVARYENMMVSINYSFRAFCQYIG